MAIVYRHTKQDNSLPFYIGIGRDESRAYDFKKRSTWWKKTYDKHGVSVEVLASGLNYNDACELEMFLISEYGRIDNGSGCLVNMTDGGEGSNGFKHSKESRQKMSDSLQGNIPWNKGIARTQSTKDKIGNANRGKKRTDANKLKLSIAGKGRIFTDTHKQRMSEARMGIKRHPSDMIGIAKACGHSILQYDLEGNFIQEFYAIKTAAKLTGITREKIQGSLKGLKQRGVNHFVWKYKTKT